MSAAQTRLVRSNAPTSAVPLRLRLSERLQLTALQAFSALTANTNYAKGEGEVLEIVTPCFVSGGSKAGFLVSCLGNKHMTIQRATAVREIGSEYSKGDKDVLSCELRAGDDIGDQLLKQEVRVGRLCGKE
ncbi:hypothetical protein JOB18_024269 [Solea senegalensis]|uniref:Uncharacterized protein n=1 Tax=Solea senegalensis TaxID=28829 RepID=A0AAV6SM12_SOLSE|nr:hypothetical protein JOB18_024269 [Solea senegalensis]